jgi:hypothetical protein
VLFPKSVLVPNIVKRLQAVTRTSSVQSNSSTDSQTSQTIPDHEVAEKNLEYENYTAEDDEALVMKREEKEQDEIGREIKGKKSILSDAVFHAISLGMGLNDVLGQLVVEKQSSEASPDAPTETTTSTSDQPAVDDETPTEPEAKPDEHEAKPDDHPTTQDTSA